MARGKAGIRKDSWNHWQDEKLISIMQEHKQNGKQQNEAFEAAALSIGKSVSACKGRWFQTLRKPAEKESEVNSAATEKATRTDDIPRRPEDYDFRFERSDGKWKLYIEIDNIPQNQNKIQSLIGMFHQL